MASGASAHLKETSRFGCRYQSREYRTSVQKCCRIERQSGGSDLEIYKSRSRGYRHYVAHEAYKPTLRGDLYVPSSSCAIRQIQREGYRNRR
jgi:hypothetical protein